MHPAIAQHRDEILALCVEYGVSKLDVFGSVCTEEFDDAPSDIDFLVEYPPNYDFGPWLGRLQDFESSLADLLGRDVDVVPVSALCNSWFQRESEKTRKVIYHGSKISNVA